MLLPNLVRPTVAEQVKLLVSSVASAKGMSVDRSSMDGHVPNAGISCNTMVQSCKTAYVHIFLQLSNVLVPKVFDCSIQKLPDRGQLHSW
jgi:hypothetical protein